MRKISALLVMICCLQHAWAGGFQLNLQGSRQLGMGHTGVGVALDGSAMYFNPGALAFVNQRQFQIGGSLVMPTTTYLVPNPGIDLTQTEEQFYTPFYFYGWWRSHPASPFSIGLAINNPFGTQIRWPDIWPGMYISQELSLNSIFIQPTASYRINARFSVGLGISYGNTNLLMRRALMASTISSTVPSSLSMSMKGDGFGFNAGLFFRPNTTFSIGLSYRSPIYSGITNGQATFDVPESLRALYQDTEFQTEITLPGVLNLGLGYRPQESVLITFDINYTGWGVYDSLNFEFDSEELPDLESERNYKNAFAFRFGTEYHVSEKLALRGGLYYDQSPVQDGFVSPELPDADRIGFTAGAGLNMAERLSLDLSFMYETTGERTTAFSEEGFGGTYQSNTFVVGMGLNYSF